MYKNRTGFEILCRNTLNRILNDLNACCLGPVVDGDGHPMNLNQSEGADAELNGSNRSKGDPKVEVTFSKAMVYSVKAMVTFLNFPNTTFVTSELRRTVTA